MKETFTMEKKWKIRKWADDEAYHRGDDPFEVCEFEGNMLLNEGINNALLPLLCGDPNSVSPVAYSNTDAYIGVGNDNTAEDSTQTGLLGTATYVAMEAGYPTIGSQKATWRAVFDGSTGNHDWREFTICNGNSNTGDNLNRKVSDQGTKAAGQTWTLDLEITFS
jgi:hypothetical protein